jgi:NAD(P)-dependent dehydrogenase (short-subunit alcohol dehydrogenase family)
VYFRTMTRALEDKVAIITGGASGIGRASVLSFVEQGARVVIGDLDETRARETIELAGPEHVRFQACDVSKEADVQALVQRALNEFGKLDCMFNNAGMPGAVGPLVDIDVDAWDRTFSVLVRGVFLGIKHAARAMMASAAGGVIVNTSSIAGLHAGAGPIAYSACKSAVISITRSAAVELAPQRIRVNAVCPGLILTPLLDRGQDTDLASVLSRAQPWPEAGTPAHVAQAALFLASDQSRFMTGETLVLDGGITARGPGVFAEGNAAGRAIADSISRSLRAPLALANDAPIGFDPGSSNRP